MPGLDNFSDLSEAITSVPAAESITLQQLIREHWLPSLNGNLNNERISLHEKSICLVSAQAYVNRWKRPQIYFDNFAKRLEGLGYLPPLVLQNPPKQEWLTYEEMATKVQTCILLNDILKAMQLNLRHIPTINMLPFITEDWLDSLSPADREKALRESLDLTVLIFKSYRLETVISCQCLSQGAPKWLELIVDHPLVKALSSTVRGAVSQTVKRVPFAGRTINVIQGFHPSYILRAPNPEYRNDRLRILTSVLTETYNPCQKWAKQNIANDLVDTAHQLQTTASAMLALISKYQTLESQLHNLFEDSALWYYNKEGTNNLPRTDFSIHTWIKAIRLFLSLLPSQTMDLELRNMKAPSR
jgi:hypothetical protein